MYGELRPVFRFTLQGTPKDTPGFWNETSKVLKAEYQFITTRNHNNSVFSAEIYFRPPEYDVELDFHESLTAPVYAYNWTHLVKIEGECLILYLK